MKNFYFDYTVLISVPHILCPSSELIVSSIQETNSKWSAYDDKIHHRIVVASKNKPKNHPVFFLIWEELLQ